MVGKSLPRLLLKIKRLDDAFFVQIPTSSFTIDERIPSQIRALLSEADGSRKNNFRTGASACMRKAIYKLLQHQGIPSEKDGKYLTTDDRLGLLKDRLAGTHPHLDGQMINWLGKVQGINSIELHENDWKYLDAPTLEFLSTVIHQVLADIYVVPDNQKSTQSRLYDLAKKAGGGDQEDKAQN